MDKGENDGKVVVLVMEPCAGQMEAVDRVEEPEDALRHDPEVAREYERDRQKERWDRIRVFLKQGDHRAQDREGSPVV